MKKLIVSLLSISLFLIAQISFAAETTVHQVYSKTVEQKKLLRDRAQLLLFQHAESADVKALEKQCYEISLKDSNPYVIYFSNTPQKFTGHLDIKEFLAIWDHDYKTGKLQPNGLIHAQDLKTKQAVNYVFSFTQPPRYDENTKAISYKVCSLEKQAVEATALKDINIFFDPYHKSP